MCDIWGSESDNNCPIPHDVMGGVLINMKATLQSQGGNHDTRGEFCLPSQIPAFLQMLQSWSRLPICMRTPPEIHRRDLEDPLRDNGSLNVPDQRDTTTKKGVQFGIMTAIAIESWIHPFGSTLTSP